MIPADHCKTDTAPHPLRLQLRSAGTARTPRAFRQARPWASSSSEQTLPSSFTARQYAFGLPSLCDCIRHGLRYSLGVDIPNQHLGQLIVVSGPSGTGKTTLCRKACDAGLAVFSVSCTTRQPRPGEVDGVDYHFLTASDFQERITRGEFFEYAQVHDRWYGTLKETVYSNLRAGTDVLMDIDVQGAAQIRDCGDELVRRCLLDIFVLPPSIDELRLRLAGRATEDEATFELRMRNAADEMEHWTRYQQVLVSQSREDDETRFRTLLLAGRMRTTLWTPASSAD